LREVAERARQSERRFRSEAEARATFAQALLLINRGRQPEAERLMSKIQMDAIEPSLDAAGVFRCLGEWKVTQGNWGEASGYFLRTLLANQVDRTDKTQATTWDLLRASPALVAAGSPERYHKFVGETLLHYSGTEDPVAAEQIIKTCLLLPADTAALRRLNPFAELVEKTVTGSASAGAGAEGYAWRTFSLGLFYYRLGDYAKASEWAEKSLNGSDRTPSRVAMVHVLLAMNQAKLGQLESARRELAVGQKLIEQKLPDGLRNVPDLGTSTTGYWHDWVMGQILLREASQAVTEKSPLLETGKLGAPAPRVLDTVLDFSLSSPEGGEGRGEEADGFSSSNPLTPTQVRALNP
jgi:tetratricopeptide (TPR) repeat protein